MIAALYVDPKGIYSTMDGVELWGLPDKDARDYAGPWPVVVHPPCTRWCRLAGLVEARYGYKVGDDGECFKAALESVRRWGGVLEHPAYSKAWAAYDLNRPPTGGGWVQADWHSGHKGWACYVEQGLYGHQAKKATWLYVCGVELASLKWGHTPDKNVKATVSWCGNNGDNRKRISKKTASATPRKFACELLAMAKTAKTAKTEKG